MNRPPITLQISLAPSDYLHACVLLPHQVRTWRGQVAEILLTIDFHRSAGRFSERWTEGGNQILPLAQSIPDARVLTVDYDPTSKARVSTEFFGGRPVPAKDFRGGPYYAYFSDSTPHKTTLCYTSTPTCYSGAEVPLGWRRPRRKWRSTRK